MQIRALKKEIAKSVNILDYKGSMIYDEYPDRFMLLVNEEILMRCADIVKIEGFLNFSCGFIEKELKYSHSHNTMAIFFMLQFMKRSI